MKTLVVAVGGAVITWWLARAAGRYAVIDRTRPLAGSRRLPAWVRGRLASLLDAAAIDVAPEHAVQIWLLAAAGAAAIGISTRPLVASIVVLGVLIGGPAGLWLARHRRGRQITAAVPGALDTIAADLRAGGTVVTGIATLATTGGPLAGDFARVETRVRLGATLPDALVAWSREREVAGTGSVAGALALAGSVGGHCADALEGLATSLRERLAVVAEARALAAQARYSAVVVGAGPIVYLVLSAIVDPRSVRVLVATPFGRVCAVAGLVLDVAGALWMRRILAGVDR